MSEQPTNGRGPDPVEKLLIKTGEMFRPPSPQLRQQTWALLKHELDRGRASSRRRFRPGRLALAASLLGVGVGLGGYVAVRGGLTQQPVVPNQVAVNNSLPLPIGQSPKSVTADPVMSGHPVASTSFTLTDGDHVLPLLPIDPLRPFVHRDWFYPVPTYVSDFKFDPATRALKFKLRQIASPAALDRARKMIALAYNAKGRTGVEPADINIQPLQRVGYNLVLPTSQGDLPLKERHGGPIVAGKMSVSVEIPTQYTALITNLTSDPDFVSLVATGYYDFEYSTSASTEAAGLRSASRKALQQINGGKHLTGPVIVDRRGKQEYLQRMRNEVVLYTRGSGMEAEPMGELALKQLSSLEPMSFREFLDQPGQLLIWNNELGRLDLQPEKYDLVTRETRKHLEEQDQIKTLSKSISDLATHEADASKFYNRLQETMDLHVKANGGIPGVFSADLALDLKKTYDQLSSGERQRVADLKRSASNESEFESKHLRISDEQFSGDHHIVGTTPKGFDLYLISDEAIVGETLFGSHQVKVFDVKTVAISEELTIEVEKIDTKPPEASQLAVTPPPPPAAIGVPIGTPLPYAGRAETLPDGYLVADGRELRRDEFPELFHRIGTIYGRGDGDTTFNLPDYRGEFLRGVDDAGTARGARGVDGGRTVGSVQAYAFEQHTHAQKFWVNLLHNHRVINVFHVNGNANASILTDGQPISMNALIMGFPYGHFRTLKTPTRPDGIPVGEYAGDPQPPPFEGGHKLSNLDGEQDDRWAVTTSNGNPKQPVEGSIDGANTGSHAPETRPRNIAVIYMIRAK